jgi:hypothetical protein
VLQYDPAADRWTVVATLPAPRSAAVAQVVGDQLIVTTGTPTGVAPQTDTWSHPLPFAGGVAALVPQITSPLPSAALAGGRGAATVRVTNDGTERVSGPADVALYLSAGPALDPGAAVRLATVRRRLKLAPGSSRVIQVAFRYPAVASAAAAGSGSYYLVAQVSPATSAVPSTWPAVASASTATVELSSPSAHLTGSIEPPAHAMPRTGRRATVSLVVRNTGNATADGPLDISLSASARRAETGGITLLKLRRHVHIPPGGAVMIRLRFARPTVLASGTYYLAATLDGTRISPPSDPANTAIFSDTPFEVT